MSWVPHACLGGDGARVTPKLQSSGAVRHSRHSLFCLHILSCLRIPSWPRDLKDLFPQCLQTFCSFAFYIEVFHSPGLMFDYRVIQGFSSPFPLITQSPGTSFSKIDPLLPSDFQHQLCHRLGFRICPGSARGLCSDRWHLWLSYSNFATVRDICRRKATELIFLLLPIIDLSISNYILDFSLSSSMKYLLTFSLKLHSIYSLICGAIRHPQNIECLYPFC